jgi:hypothetical protein
VWTKLRWVIAWGRFPSRSLPEHVIFLEEEPNVIRGCDDALENCRDGFFAFLQDEIVGELERVDQERSLRSSDSIMLPLCVVPVDEGAHAQT